MSERYTARTVVHMIGQAHLDPVWLWRWTEGRAEAPPTSRSAVDRLREYPDFQFVRGEAQIYEWIEDEDPQLFAEIVELIRQGRWHVVNGMIVQPDMNLPQGESFVRQFLPGRAYMREHLGVEPRVAYCVDSFGHAGTLPQISEKCGFDAYVFMRPGFHEKPLPGQAFWWQSPDGSRVLAFRITAVYPTRRSDRPHLLEHIERAVRARSPGLNHTMCFFGVGNHGGGPTKRQIENVQAIAPGYQLQFPTSLLRRNLAAGRWTTEGRESAGSGRGAPIPCRGLLLRQQRAQACPPAGRMWAGRSTAEHAEFAEVFWVPQRSCRTLRCKEVMI